MNEKRMFFTRPAVVILLVFAVVLLVTSNVVGQVDAQQITNYLEQVRNETGAPGISVAVAVNGEIVYSEGVGYAELDNMVPATGSTVHNIGSVSKVLATVAVMQLVEQGKVNLDDPIQKYVPYFPEKKWKVTVRHILTHTSGIRHYKRGEFGPLGLLEAHHFDKFENAIDFWKEDPLLFKPGDYYSYSSHAFNLLHGLVETVTGMDFEEYQKKHIWEPAGMLSTSFDVPSRIVPNRGRGYGRNRSGIVVNTRYVDPSYKYASGGVLSTVENLVKFGIALNNGTLMKPETVDMMYEVQVDPVMRFNPNGEPQKQGHKQALGWFIRFDIQGRGFPSHTGTVKGTRSYLLNYPEYGLVLALQTNIVPFDSPKYGNAIAQMFLPPVNPAYNKKK